MMGIALEVRMSTKIKKRRRRQFTAEFKADAVRLVTKGGLSFAQASADLGIHESSLREWARRTKVDAGDGPPGELSTRERAELAKLRRENRILREEREILKKAAAFFAKESP